MQPHNVLLLFGGESSEHEVSLLSAKNVIEAIDIDVYNVILGYITKTGQWYLVDSLLELKQDPNAQLQADFASNQFVTGNGDSFRPDVILPILHGKNGEDGALQGLAQLMHIPIVGCDMTASVLAMDKVASKALFKEVGLNVLPYRVHHAHENVLNYTDIVRELGDIIFVKPSRAGSSVGVSKATSEAEYQQAIEQAVQHDTLVLIEQAANMPREIEVAILGNAGTREASTPGEIIPDREFYSYDSKYSEDSGSSMVIPADIEPNLANTIRKQALIAYDALHCSGMARVDFLLDGNDELYINEINTIPGFTNMSMYPKLWIESGVAYSILIDKLLQLAILKTV
jgi:D-alanine-D-alanine ligase